MPLMFGNAKEKYLDDHAVVVADTAGVIRFWSAGAEKAFGYAVERALGETLDLIVPPDYRQAHWNGFHKAIASGAAAVEGQSVPFPARRADGETATMSGRLTLLREPNGSVIAAVVVFTQPQGFDIGSRRAAGNRN
jgi:PAS domain S-box-containing protein